MKRSSLLASVLLAIGTTASIISFAADEPKGNLRYSISVSKFDNKSGWHGQWDLGRAWGAVLTDALQQSGRFIVLGETDMRVEAMREQDLASSGRAAKGKKTPQTGRMTPAQLLVKGDITHVQSSTTGGKGGLSFKGIRIGGSGDTAEITAVIYLVDAQTGQVKASKQFDGKAGRKGLSLGYHGSALGGLGGDLAGFQKDNLGKATSDAIAQAVPYLVEQLDGIPWQGNVAAVTDDTILINRGTREGVADGQEFDVGMGEEIVDEDTGETLDFSIKKIGRIRVIEAKEKISRCQALDGAGKIEKGMMVQPGKAN